MSSIPRYESYIKHSAPTYAELPGTWASIRARHVARIRTGTGDTADAESGGDYPFYVRSDKPLRSVRWEFDTTAVLTAGDGAGVAKVFHLVEGKFMAHQRVYVIDDFRHVIPGFFYYAFSSLFHLMALDGSAKSTVDSVRRPMIADMPIPVPPMGEQEIILRYLDRETAQIDTLIEAQQQLVETLRERRSAVVDSIVWSGLDESAEKSPTGIDPVPFAPAHWLRRRNKDILRESTELSADGSEELLTVSHLTGITTRASKRVNMIEAESLVGYRLVEVGDLVINTMWAWMGALGVSTIEGVVSPAYGVYRPTTGVDYHPAYFDHLYRSTPYVVEMTRHSRGIWESRLRLYPDVFLRLPVVIPPLHEQLEIAAFLGKQTARIDALIAEAERFIELSRERRSALITAAVTGQINVRGEVA